MAGYLGTGITGILMALMINMGFKTVYKPDISFWHVELALLMIIGTLIHIHIYRKQFKKLFKASAFKSTKET